MFTYLFALDNQPLMVVKPFIVASCRMWFVCKLCNAFMLNSDPLLAMLLLCELLVMLL